MTYSSQSHKKLDTTQVTEHAGNQKRKTIFQSCAQKEEIGGFTMCYIVEDRQLLRAHYMWFELLRIVVFKA